MTDVEGEITQYGDHNGAIIRCPGCKNLLSLGAVHEVLPDMTVTGWKQPLPSVICTVAGCTFHDTVRIVPPKEPFA